MSSPALLHQNNFAKLTLETYPRNYVKLTRNVMVVYLPLVVIAINL